MASIKMTFSLDEEAVAGLQMAAERLSLPKSEVVREAILDYCQRLGRLSERERLRLLKTFDELLPTIPTKSDEEVDRELAEIRRARRTGGRRTRVEP